MTALQASRPEIFASTAATICSIELVEVINSLREDGKAELRHDNFMTKVDKVLGTEAPKFLGTQKYGNNITRQVYNFPKREASLMVMSESYAVQARVYDRMVELESAGVPRFNIPTTLSAALRLAAEQADTIDSQSRQIEAAQPAVDFVGRYVESDGAKGFRQVCKLLGANESDFREFLLDKKIMYRLNGEWAPHAQHQGTGRFVVKAGTSEVSNHAYNQALFTPKGVTWVAGEWAKFKITTAV